MQVEFQIDSKYNIRDIKGNIKIIGTNGVRSIQCDDDKSERNN